MDIEMDVINARVEWPKSKSLTITAQGIVKGDEIIAVFALESSHLVLNTPQGNPIGWIEARA